MPSSKTDLVETKQEHGVWVAQAVDNPLLIAVGNTKEEAIGKLWLDSLGDALAHLLDLQSQEIDKLKAELEEVTRKLKVTIAALEHDLTFALSNLEAGETWAAIVRIKQALASLSVLKEETESEAG